MKLSLVVSTLGRQGQLARLFTSLADQTMSDFEVLVVDQNEDDALLDILNRNWPFIVRRIHTPGERGASRGRNRGWPQAQGQTVLFPDDDCCYPTNFFERALAVLDLRNVDILCGRAADTEGRSINGRYESEATAITKRNVFTTQIEWVVFFRKRALEAVGGYDEDIGVGAATPWGACEGQDIVLRALQIGLAAYFDPTLYGYHHELDVITPDATMRAKGRAYARGFGYVLSKHNFGPQHAAYWVGRAAFNLGRALLKGDLRQAPYYANVALGRIEGYVRRAL